jgi:hypothetical protein
MPELSVANEDRRFQVLAQPYIEIDQEKRETEA